MSSGPFTCNCLDCLRKNGNNIIDLTLMTTPSYFILWPGLSLTKIAINIPGSGMQLCLHH